MSGREKSASLERPEPAQSCRHRLRALLAGAGTGAGRGGRALGDESLASALEADRG